MPERESVGVQPIDVPKISDTCNNGVQQTQEIDQEQLLNKPGEWPKNRPLKINKKDKKGAQHKKTKAQFSKLWSIANKKT